ncbi:uncharacterized protein LOC124454388 isoform X1 [Xenia sp. Carnegie-2017]|uniref:uncharacterized protein LOC124454388 isoform X1 n=1 Tax=Xenia sp. Carnegie-2017 TaxID=2897299 RepID=UPI001F03A20F|nr:uncharacterized protein LOC124454388 isoform X1 [Xenia sp. Carnegie-2017]
MLIYFSSLYEVLKNHEVKKPLLMPEIYYTIVYSMKRVQEMMDKVTDKSTGQVRTKELSHGELNCNVLLREIQMELLELRKMIHQFNNRYNDIFRFQSFDHEEFCQVMKDFGELSKRWSELNNKKISDSRRIINSAHLTIGDKVIEIESVSSNGIVLKYKILYYEIITVIEMIESNIRVIKKDKQSQQTAALIGEMMDQVQEIKIKQLEDLISEVNMAENVDSKELDELNKEFEDFESRLTRIKDFLSNTNDEPDGPISTNDIVLIYKTSCPKILSAVERLEERIEKIQAETPSQQNAKELKVIQKKMQSISCQMQTEMSKQLIERWFILVKNYNKEIMRQPVVVREIRTRQTSHSAQLTIGDKVIDIESVSSNGIVIKYKILYHEIITIIKMLENNIKIIKKAEPSQKTAALLDENIQRLHSLQKTISELNQLMIEIKVAENVDVKELEQLQIEHKDLMTHLAYVNAFISKEKEKQPVLITKIVYDIRREEAIVRSLHTRVKIILT